MNASHHTPKAHNDISKIDAYARGLWIGGEWLPASEGGVIDVIDPSTEAIIATVPDATVLDGAAAVEAAARAAKEWRRTPPRKRSEILRRCFELMIEQSEAAGLVDFHGKRQGVARREGRSRLCRRVLPLER